MPESKKQYQEYLEFATSLALEAGEIMHKYFGADSGPRFKHDNSVVTIADEEINDLVIRRVKQTYPDHDINGEEASNQNGSKYVWVCDPIDGTAKFAAQVPVSVFSLALVIDGKPEVGVIYAPFNDHMYTAVIGQGAFMNGRPIKVNSKKLSDRAELNVDWWASNDHDVIKVVREIVYSEGSYATSIGSTTHASALVARGEFVASVFPGTKGKNVDIAAAKVIVEEAGGKVTDLFGNEQRYDQDIRGSICSNGVVHDEIVKSMKEMLV
ncbi:hypothetical protein CSA80_03890 [Candidatus Saccharibacteria bacterium]|nr:MAG: hypothetical protein CSA80_03890 [Candidatus Saccharibacteria bacterium]